MTMFRNDHEAALARLSALEAENARLLAENASLRAPKPPPPVVHARDDRPPCMFHVRVDRVPAGGGMNHEAVLARIAELEIENARLVDENHALQVPQSAPPERVELEPPYQHLITWRTVLQFVLLLLS
jgi:hypothetical protein